MLHLRHAGALCDQVDRAWRRAHVRTLGDEKCSIRELIPFHARVIERADADNRLSEIISTNGATIPLEGTTRPLSMAWVVALVASNCLQMHRGILSLDAREKP